MQQRSSSRYLARQRDLSVERLGRATRWVTLGAIGLAAALSAAVAVQLPGHSKPASSSGAAPTTSDNSGDSGTPTGSSGSASPSGGGTGLSAPSTAPVQTVPPAPAPVVSGGS